MKIVLKFLISAIAIIAGAYLLNGVHVSSFLMAIGVALVMSLLNIFVKPLFILLTLPVTVLTLGIFLLFINAFMFYLADALLSGFTIDTFWNAFFFSIVYSLILSMLEWLLGLKDDGKEPM